MGEPICLVSGAAKGIGRETLLQFLANGYFCIGLDKDQAGLRELFEEIATEDRKGVLLAEMDLLQETELPRNIADRLQSPGVRLTLVNNVGGSSSMRKLFEDNTWEGFAETLHFNLKPLHTLTRACIPIMKKNRYGKIVNVSSVSGRKALKNVGAEYAAAKSAIIGISRHLASELVEDGILVNTVCPGIIGTERMIDRFASRDEQVNQKVLETIPVRRLGTPKEVADAIYYLGSEANGYVTGAILDVNGGMHCP